MSPRTRLPPVFWITAAMLTSFGALCIWLVWTSAQLKQRLDVNVSGVSGLLELKGMLQAPVEPSHVWTDREIARAAEATALGLRATRADAHPELQGDLAVIEGAVARLRGAPAAGIARREAETFAAMDRVIAALRADSRTVSILLGERWNFLNVVAGGAILLCIMNLALLALTHRRRMLAEAGQAELDNQISTLRAVTERWTTGDLDVPLVPRGAEPDTFERALDDMRRKLVVKIEEIERKTRTIEELDGELRHQLHERSLALAVDLSFHAIREAREPRRGDVLAGRYVVEDRLGFGAMGDVWRVRRSPDDRSLALKVLRRVSEERHRLRFVREVALLARVRHPNVIAVYDMGVSPGGVPYLVTEIVEGARLEDTIAASRAGAPVSSSCALAILRDVAEGLRAIHAVGVVHRDIKPGNILLAERTGEAPLVKIIDFGVARLADADSSETSNDYKLSRKEPSDSLRPADPPDDSPRSGDSLRSLDATEDGALVGTPHYIAPELRGGAAPTAAADIFAFGVTGYRLLTGSMPFRAPAILAREKPMSSPAPLLERCPDLPPGAAALIAACLSFEPAERPSAAQLVEGLGQGA